MQRNLYLLFLAFFLFPGFLHSQNNTWFTDVSAQVGLASTPEALRLNVRDINGDDYPDIISVESVNRRNMIHVYLNVQDTASTNPLDRMFIDWTDSSGVNVHPHPDSTGGRRSEIVTLADVDNDGDPDMVSGIWHWEPATLNWPDDRSSVLLNDGTGRFTHVPNNGFDALGLISIGGFAYFDYDQDGNLDVFVSTFADDIPNTQFRKDYIMKGAGDGTFTERQGPFDLNTIIEPNYGVSATDWNNDGHQDILTAPYCRDDGTLWQNNGGFSFQDVSFQANYDLQQLLGDGGQAMCAWGSYPMDFDNDGDMDVFHSLVHGGLDSAEGRSTIASNLGASQQYRFQWEMDRLRRTGVQSSHLGNMDAAWLDIDNNGLVDLVHSETEYHPFDRMYVYLQDSTHYFDDVTSLLGLTAYVAHTIEAVDYDLDGDYDLIFNDRDDNTQIRVLRNNIGNQNNYLCIKLDPPAGVNADGIGTRIQVTSGGVTQTREVQAGVGHWGGQNPLVQLFGLGQNGGVDSVYVQWPGGLTTTYYGPAINQTITIDGSLVTEVKPGNTPKIYLYPNPNQGRFTLGGWDFSQTSTQVRVRDLVGREVETRIAQNGFQATLEMAQTSAGVYFVEITDEAQGVKEVLRVVVE